MNHSVPPNTTEPSRILPPLSQPPNTTPLPTPSDPSIRRPLPSLSEPSNTTPSSTLSPPAPTPKPKPVTRGPSTRGLSDSLRLNICRELLNGTPAKIIAAQQGCTLKSVYTVAHNLRTYGSVRKPIDADGEVKPLGRPTKLSDADAEALFEELLRSGWMEQSEMVKWLRAERGIEVSQSTMSRFLKQRKWSETSLRAYCITQSEGGSGRRRGRWRKRKAEGEGGSEDAQNILHTQGMGSTPQNIPNTHGMEDVVTTENTGPGNMWHLATASTLASFGSSFHGQVVRTGGGDDDEEHHRSP